VTDNQDNRVLEYFSPLTNTKAGRVFGQSNSFNTIGCDQAGINADGLCLRSFGVLVQAKTSAMIGRLGAAGSGLALDASNNLFVADSGNNRVVVYLAATPQPTPTRTPKPTATPTPKPSATPTP